MEILNLGVFAHADAGKTTTVEHLLFNCGMIRSLGSVDDGTAVTDALDIERARGISVKSACAAINYDNLCVNIIDTPGHMDFTSEVQRTLLAVDCGLLIISAAEGVQSQTELFFKAMAQMKIPLVIFVNKIDRTGVETEKITAEIKSKLSENIFAVNSVLLQGDRNCAVNEECNFSEDDTLGLCAIDDELGESFLNGETLSRSQLEKSLFKLCAKGEAFPLIFGASALGVGIKTLERVILKLPRFNVGHSQNLSGTIYKIEHDKTMGKAAHIRLFSGMIKNRDNITLLRNTDEPIVEKVTQIRRFSAGTRQMDSGELTAGILPSFTGYKTPKSAT